MTAFDYIISQGPKGIILTLNILGLMVLLPLSAYWYYKGIKEAKVIIAKENKIRKGNIHE